MKYYFNKKNNAPVIVDDSNFLYFLVVSASNKIIRLMCCDGNDDSFEKFNIYRVSKRKGSTKQLMYDGPAPDHLLEMDINEVWDAPRSIRIYIRVTKEAFEASDI